MWLCVVEMVGPQEVGNPWREVPPQRHWLLPPPVQQLTQRNCVSIRTFQVIHRFRFLSLKEDSCVINLRLCGFQLEERDQEVAVWDMILGLTFSQLLFNDEISD